MQTSATYRWKAPAKTRAQTRCSRRAGFTILELLVVLTLLAGLTSLVLPQLSRLFDSGQRSFERRQVLDDIAALPYAAFQQQQAFLLQSFSGNATDVPLVLPEGWKLKVSGDAGIRYRANGFCEGGELQLYYDDLVERVRLEPPLCAPGW